MYQSTQSYFAKLSTAALLSTTMLLTACGGESPKVHISDPSKGQSMAQYVKGQNFSGAILVIDDGQTKMNRGFGRSNKAANRDNDKDTVFRLASVTKQFTAMAVMILQERNMLNIDDSISTYLPSYPRGNEITLKQLLTHTSGIRNYTELSLSDSAWHNIETPQELLATFENKPLDFTPGSKYRYSNSGYAVLGVIIEAVSGISYADFIQSEIFTPLGMTRSTYALDNMGSDNTAQGYSGYGLKTDSGNMKVPYAAGALASTITDLYKWDQSFYDNSLVSEQTKALIFTPARQNYGLGWVIGHNNGLNYAHGGGIKGFSTYVQRFPEQKKLIVVLSNVTNFPANEMAEHLNSLL